MSAEPEEISGQVMPYNGSLADELATLRGKVAELQLVNHQLAGLRDDSDLPAEQRDRITARTAQEFETQQIRDKVARMRAADGWTPPETAQNLAAELAIPRATAQYRIEGLAGWNHNILLSGGRKTGKSQLAVNLDAALSAASASSAATGTWQPGYFLGSTQCWLGGSVAYVNAEMDADDWRDVYRRLPPGSYDPARIHALHVRGRPFPVITNPAAREWFTAWLREHGVEHLTIDTWGALCQKNGVRNLNDDAEARRVTDGLDEIKAEAGVRSLAVLIHTPHQAPGMRHLERFKGAGAVGDWADVLWNYVADEDGTRYLSAAGRARIEMAEQSLYFDQATGRLTWGMTGSRAQTAATRDEARITGALAKADGQLTEDLLDAVGGNRARIRGLVKTMTSDGRLVRKMEGRAARYFLPD